MLYPWTDVHSSIFKWIDFSAWILPWTLLGYFDSSRFHAMYSKGYIFFDSIHKEKGSLLMATEKKLLKIGSLDVLRSQGIKLNSAESIRPWGVNLNTTNRWWPVVSYHWGDSQMWPNLREREREREEGRTSKERRRYRRHTNWRNPKSDAVTHICPSLVSSRNFQHNSSSFVVRKMRPH